MEVETEDEARKVPPDLVEFVAIELLRFNRNEDEEEVARRIIREVLSRTQ